MTVSSCTPDPYNDDRRLDLAVHLPIVGVIANPGRERCRSRREGCTPSTFALRQALVHAGKRIESTFQLNTRLRFPSSAPRCIGQTASRATRSRRT